MSEYLDGKWDSIESELTATKDIAALPQMERSDIDRIRRALGECRPAWWKVVKAGKKVTFRPLVWGHAISATYDPAGKINIQIHYVNEDPSLTVAWDAADMDNPAQAEHGFTKGDLGDLGIWLSLGTGQSWMEIPLQSQADLDEQARLQLNRYLSFRGNVAAAYYGTPRARRWGLWLDLAGYLPKYAEMPTAISRRAVGAFFVQEILTHRDHYRSITLPGTVPADSTEEKLAIYLKDHLEKHGLTLDEDETLRASLKAFAIANAAKARQSQKIALPDATAVSLDPQLDKAESAKRDDWIKTHLEAGAK